MEHQDQTYSQETELPSCLEQLPKKNNNEEENVTENEDDGSETGDMIEFTPREIQIFSKVDSDNIENKKKESQKVDKKVDFSIDNHIDNHISIGNHISIDFSRRQPTSTIETNEICVCAKPVSPDVKVPTEQTGNQHGNSDNNYTGSIGDQAVNNCLGSIGDQAVNNYNDSIGS